MATGWVISERRKAVGSVILGLAAATMLSGTMLEFLAWKRASLAFAIAGLTLLLLGPAFAVIGRVASGSVVNAAGGSDAALLIDSVHGVDAALQAIRLARAHIGVAAASVFVFGLCQLLGLIDTWRFVLAISLMSATAALLYLPWLARLERRAQRQRAALQQRLGELSTVQNWFAG